LLGNLLFKVSHSDHGNCSGSKNGGADSGGHVLVLVLIFLFLWLLWLLWNVFVKVTLLYRGKPSPGDAATLTKIGILNSGVSLRGSGGVESALGKNVICVKHGKAASVLCDANFVRIICAGSLARAGVSLICKDAFSGETSGLRVTDVTE